MVKVRYLTFGELTLTNQNNSRQKQIIMKSTLFLIWALSALAFLYHAVWCEPTLQNIHHTVFFGCIYIMAYHEWKDAEREEEFNRRVVEQGRKLREELKGKIQNYEEIIDYIENLSKK